MRLNTNSARKTTKNAGLCVPDVFVRERPCFGQIGGGIVHLRIIPREILSSPKESRSASIILNFHSRQVQLTLGIHMSCTRESHSVF